MAMDRKSALKRLRGLLPRVEEHLELLEKEPDSLASQHWQGEIKEWLQHGRGLTPCRQKNRTRMAGTASLRQGLP
jgi:hypothetical protein